jgi:hypothetical protein
MIRIVVLAFAVAACGGTKRSTQQYRADSEAALQTRHGQIEACYQKALEADPKTHGTLTIHFTVEKKTGRFKNASVDTTKSSAPEPIVNCVIGGLTGLKLEPADKNEGRATFVYQLQPAS